MLTFNTKIHVYKYLPLLRSLTQASFPRIFKEFGKFVDSFPFASLYYINFDVLSIPKRIMEYMKIFVLTMYKVIITT